MNEENNNSQKGLTLEIKLKLSEFEVSDLIVFPANEQNHKYFSKDNNKFTTLFFPVLEHPPQS